MGFGWVIRRAALRARQLLGGHALRRSLRRLLASRPSPWRLGRTIQRHKVFEVRAGDERGVLKLTHEAEVAVHRDLLPRWSDLSFRRLALPRWLDGGTSPEVGPWMIARWIEPGLPPFAWHEWRSALAGGRALDEGAVAEAAGMIADLALIDPGNVRGVTPKREARSAAKAVARAQAHGILGKEHGARALELLQKVRPGPLRVSNGDFQFRNFIRVSAERTALVDWSDATVSPWELERCAATLWLLLWNNEACRRALVRDVPALDRDGFRRMVLGTALKFAGRRAAYPAGMRRAMVEAARAAIENRLG